MTSSPGTSLSMWRNGRVLVTRWPATTTLPTWPGRAVPGQWLGPRSIDTSEMPWLSGTLSPSLGISMVPSSTWGSWAYSSAGGAAGWGAGSTNVVVVVGGTVVVVVGGAVVVVVLVVVDRKSTRLNSSHAN